MNIDSLKKLKYIIENEKPTKEQLLWIKYADKFGLNIEWLDQQIINTKTSNIYIILGLTWKYIYGEIVDDSISNKLLIHLKFIKNKPKETKNKTQNIIKSNNLNNSNLKYYTLYSPNTLCDMFSQCSVSDTMALNVNGFSELSEKLDKILEVLITQNVKNPKVEKHPEEYITANQLITDYKFVDANIVMPTTIISPKFKIIVE